MTPPLRFPAGKATRAALVLLAAFGAEVAGSDDPAGGERDFVAVHVCDGEDEEWGHCAPQAPCVECLPTDCLFSEWGPWYDGGGCVGLQFRHRDVEVANNECGKPCEGSKIESVKHVKANCVNEIRDCTFQPWAEWSTCASVMDQSDRARGLLQQPTRGGAPCAGTLQQTRPCGGPERQDCQFAAWREWTQCSATCGEGRHSRMRRVEVEAAHGGLTCNNELLEAKPCMTEECPKEDCSLSEWSAWSMCDGKHPQRIRHRQVLRAPRGTGKPCEKVLMETSPCEGPKRADCEVTDWAEWSDCSQSCLGGQKYRERELKTPNSNGGFCPTLVLKAVQACNTEPCEATVDCAMSAWMEWSTCSVTTGLGVRSRVRIMEPASKWGTACTGPLSEVGGCQMSGVAKVDCAWGTWEDWSECSYTCGGGTTRRSRTVARPPSNGGMPCEALAKGEVAACNTQECDKGCVDARWASWMQWTQCTASCGSGYKSRMRSIDVPANKCGLPVSGLTQEFAACLDLPSCVEDRDCALSDWGAWTSCSDRCSGVRERYRQIAFFATGAGKPCADTSLKVIEPCAAHDPEGKCAEERPADCEMGEWTNWTKCTARCGGGQRERRRPIGQLARHGGRPCEDGLEVTEPCNTEPCEGMDCQDCAWGTWSSWSDCSQCGGQRTRQRAVERLPNACGQPCDLGSAKETSDCTSNCEQPYYCTWAAWSEATCSPGCGHQAATRNRQLKLMKEADDFLFKAAGGSACMGTQLALIPCAHVVECAEKKCSPRQCEFGDWSDWNAPTCMGLCERQRAISVMNNECGQPCGGELVETKSCPANCEEPKDCVLSTWSGWTACDALLTGQRYRGRAILQQPAYGGALCEGHLNETRACNIPDPEPCQMEQWSGWSTCSRSCGGGMKLRNRGVAATASQGGEQCRATLQQLQSCAEQPCSLEPQQDCALGEWDEWSGCNADNQRERNREIVQPPEGGGIACEGGLHETETCLPEAIDCEISHWTTWDECDRTCGSGQTHRQRQILRFPEHGGKLCPDALIQTKGCNRQPCEVRDCLISGWMEWSGCSTSCGQGMQSRHREVVRLRGEGGAGCFFELGETRACTHQASCAVDDCRLSPWGAWGDCSASCNGGMRKRMRSIQSMPDVGGMPCPSQVLEEVGPCGLGECHEKCYDGHFGAWGAWAPCSVSCAGGTTFRVRGIEKMANSCGKEPEGLDREEKFCNVDVECEEPRACYFDPWSDWSDCSASCSGMKRRSRGVGQYGRGKGIFCRGALQEVWPCNPGEDETEPQGCVLAPDVDCVLSEWEPWSLCSASCGGGQHLRSRSIVQHPLNGGKSCAEALSEIRECARDSCGGPRAVDCAYGEWEDWGECVKCDGERKRARKILAYAQHGGRDCKAFQSEEVGRCPRKCGEAMFCGWAQWDPWSKCTSSCGTGGKRQRRRQLQLQQELHRDVPQFAEALGRFEVLHRETEDLEASHVHDVAIAFASGGLALLAATFALHGGHVAIRRFRDQQREPVCQDESYSAVATGLVRQAALSSAGACGELPQETHTALVAQQADMATSAELEESF